MSIGEIQNIHCRSSRLLVIVVACEIMASAYVVVQEGNAF
jgi:hypothetical protein